MSWFCLYLPTTDSGPVADALRDLLARESYEPYDPFPGGTGTPPGLREMVRHFVTPPTDSWVRVVGQPDEVVLPSLQETLAQPLLYGWLTADDGGFALYQDGTRTDDPAALADYLRKGQTLDVLQQAFDGELPVDAVGSDQPPVVVAGAEDLPPELRQFAEDQGVNPRQANKLFKRLSDNLFGKLARQADDEAGDEQAQARAALMGGGGQDVWNNLHGQRVRAIASVLALPANWRTPDFDTIREAYQVHRLRQRSPRMPLMPGDKETLASVPDALDYVPVYMGKR
ncbi:MAG: hypothetical protein GYB65_00285 [Chloroflexi bacterium]|nr:hypothetical protein [Chloroflexota bacterium]